MQKIVLLLSVFFLLAGSCDKKELLPPVEENEPVEIPPVEDSTCVATFTAHPLSPNAKGRLELSCEECEQIQPGDTIYLRGRFLSIRIKGLRGSAENPVIITNYPGETLVVGDPDSDNGSYGNAIQLYECQYVVLGAEKDYSEFRITNSNISGKGTNIGVSLQPYTDHVEVKNLIITLGSVGIMAKNDPVKDNPSTWYPNRWMEGLSIHDVHIIGVRGEGMYIGHSWVYCSWNEEGKLVNAGAAPDLSTGSYVRPIMWRNVKIYNNLVQDAGWDGIQASSADQMQIYGNEVGNYGVEKVFGQCMGILVGGNSTNTQVYNNYVHDGFGDMIQFHGADGDNSMHIIRNNLLANGQSAGLGIYGQNDDPTVYVMNNTIAHCESYAVVANGRSSSPKAKLSMNLYMACRPEKSDTAQYFWVINGAEMDRVGDKSFLTVGEAKVDSDNFYQPLAGSPVGAAGYRKP